MGLCLRRGSLSVRPEVDLRVKVDLGVLCFQKKQVFGAIAGEDSEFWHRKTDPANWMNPPS